ncbi:MAG TPA: hypothetical protein VLN44_03390 [Pyrinomonadaceae bacterium]|nr:hypothetical protein [Pyrinomonadaceae bacterium]
MAETSVCGRLGLFNRLKFVRLSFDGGVLEMHCAYALRTDGMYSDNEIREVLMSKL